ncbi:acyltransferase family protein [Brevibacillus formosus]|uniref:acyltransferase n=1 Tax=Brevibacillus formosus TaxID=54913 RepID=UPI001C685B7C|nr:acyltransferase [Brevibacillus formosus]MBW5467432.1 acyltransferase family protein [Brevibacillus formosus]
MNSNRKGTFQDLNALFVFGALTVLMIHILSFFLANEKTYPWNSDLQAVLIILLKFGRSLFIFATGMLLFYWYQNRQLDWRAFWKKRWRAVILPYVIWTAIFTYFKHQTFDPAVLVGPFFDSLFTGSSFYHLYYIPLYLQLCLFFCLIKQWIERYLNFRWIIVLFIGQAGLYVLYHYLFITPLWAIDWDANPFLSLMKHTYVYGQHYVFMYVFTFALGAYAGMNVDKWRTWVKRLQIPSIVVLASAAVWMAYSYLSGYKSYYESMNIFEPLYLVYTLCVIISFYPVSIYLGKLPKLGPWLARLAKQNMAIYLVHPLILFLLQSYVIHRLGWSTPSLVLGMFVIAPPLCIFLYELTTMSFWFNRKKRVEAKPIFKNQTYKA